MGIGIETVSGILPDPQPPRAMGAAANGGPAPAQTRESPSPRGGASFDTRPRHYSG